MKARFLFLLLVFAFAAGVVFQTTWLTRHEYWGFFHSSALVMGRLILSGSISALVALLFNGFFNFILENARYKRRFLFNLFDIISTFLLCLGIYYRRYIPGRKEGNLFYEWLLISWFLLKPMLWLILFSRSEKKSSITQCRQIPRKILQSFAWIASSTPINYLFLGIILLFSIVQTIFFVLLLARSELVIWPFFLVSIIYVIAVYGIITILCMLAKASGSRRILFCISSLIFILAAIYWFDYAALTLVNMHIPEMLTTLFGEGISGITVFLETADISYTFFWSIVALLLCLPILGIVVYLLTDVLCKRYPIHIKMRHSLFVVSACLGLAFLGDLGLSFFMPTPIVLQYQHVLPLSGFFYPAQNDRLALGTLLSPPDNFDRFKAITTSQTATKTPHIFLFIIESLRDDYVQSDTAPFLYTYKKNHVAFELGLSNANITHASWMAIFNSVFPYHWYYLRSLPEERRGAIPMQLLHNLGYDINVFSSATDLSYYDVGELIFGDKYYLTTSLYQAKNESTNTAHCDRLAVDKLKEKIASLSSDNPSFNVIFLDSTHHAYYWPDDFAPPFHPYNTSFNYLGTGKAQLEMTKNRYRNAIYYVDSLVSETIYALKKQGLYDDAIIVITGDHGEEFQETGHYFHGNSLCLPQSHVALYYKFPQNAFIPKLPQLSSHIDIFPSLFDYMGLDTQFLDVLDGQSFFQPHDPIIISIKPSGGKDPYEFYLHNGTVKIEAHFSQKYAIYNSSSIDIDNITDAYDKPTTVATTKKAQEKYIRNAFGSYLNKMFREPLKK